MLNLSLAKLHKENVKSTKRRNFYIDLNLPIYDFYKGLSICRYETTALLCCSVSSFLSISSVCYLLETEAEILIFDWMKKLSSLEKSRFLKENQIQAKLIPETLALVSNTPTWKVAMDCVTCRKSVAPDLHAVVELTWVDTSWKCIVDEALFLWMLP